MARLEYGYVGEIYELVIRRPVLGAASLFQRFDSRVVDATLMGVGRSTRSLSQHLKTVESGHVQHYGLIMAAGILALLAFLVLAL